MSKKNKAAQTNKLWSAQQAQPNHHWRLYDLRMLCQCAIVSHWTQNELRMSKIHQGVSNRLKVSLELIFFGNNSSCWIITTLSWKPIGSFALWLNHSRHFFGGQFWIFAGFLNFLSSKILFLDLGIGHWVTDSFNFNF